jgi:hypothetical protein
MSHPVFLNSAPARRMPNGSRGEWQEFWEREGPELEANAFIPLLWLALFQKADLQWARFADDEDSGSEGHAEVARLGEKRYPCLVTSVEEALSSLQSRRSALAARLGNKYEPVLDAFALFLEQRYTPFVLLRTGGLPDAEDFGPELEAMLTALEELGSGRQSGESNTFVAAIDEWQRQRNADPIYRLCGADSTNKWPPETLKEKFGPERKSAKEKAPENRQGSSKLKSAVLGWVPGVTIGIFTGGAFLYTRSVWFAVVCFCVVSFAFLWDARKGS